MKSKTKKLITEDNNTKPLREAVQVKKDNVKSIEELELEDGMDVVMEKLTFRKVIQRIDKGTLIVDKSFQRGEVYRTPQKSGIINSAMTGKSIPPIYAFEDRDENGKYYLSVIDGQQRLSSIRGFMKNEYALRIPYGKMSILNNYTFSQIEKINKNLADQIGDLTLDVNVIRNIDKREAQEYFGIINTTSVPLSPGEKLWSLNDPARTILDHIVNNPYFKIHNLRKTRKGEYLIATKLLWNQMFLNPLQHDFVGNRVSEFMTYFNTTDEIARMESAKDKVLELLRIYSHIVNESQFSPRTHGDLYATICFLSVLKAKNNVNTNNLSKFINWIYRGINKQIYPITLKEQFELLLGSRVTSRGNTSPKDFVITLENLYNEEENIWS